VSKISCEKSSFLGFVIPACINFSEDLGLDIYTLYPQLYFYSQKPKLPKYLKLQQFCSYIGTFRLQNHWYSYGELFFKQGKMVHFNVHFGPKHGLTLIFIIYFSKLIISKSKMYTIHFIFIWLKINLEVLTQLTKCRNC